jgi:glycosyltransferase involved in cell wall biosynthesis
MTRRPRILVIAPYMCRGDTASGDLRLQRIIEQLASFAEVDFLTPDAEPVLVPGDRRYWSLLRKLGATIVDPLFIDRLPLWCRSRFRPYDWILIEFWYLADRLASSLEELRRELSGALIAIDSVDLNFLRELAALERGSNAYGSVADIELRQQQEISTYLCADLVIACSQEDAQSLVSVCPKPNIVIPNVVLSRPRSPGARENVIVFVGGFRHLPNVDAVLWFVNEIFPLIRVRAQDAIFRIVGSHPPAEVAALRALPGVEVLGYVSNTATWLDSAAVSVAPLRYGAGMKGKVTEALSAGLPVVTTQVGAQGLGARPGKHLHIADNAADFAEAVIEKLADPAKAMQMGFEGQALVESICGPKVVRAKLIEAFASLAPLTNRSLESKGRMVIARVKCLILPLRIHFARASLMRRQISSP